jgi:hypothetical protein
MISERSFVNKPRSLDYTHHEQKKRVDIWRRKGGVHYQAVPRGDELDEIYVESALRQAGLSREETQAFIESEHSRQKS